MTQTHRAGDRIRCLTLDQASMMPAYREKWRVIARSIEPINQARVATTIQAAYRLIRQPEPQIVFVDSPRAALEFTYPDRALIGDPVKRELKQSLLIRLWSQIESQLDLAFKYRLWKFLKQMLWYFRESEYDWVLQSPGQANPTPDDFLSNSTEFRCRLDDKISSMTWCANACWMNFCISVLNCDHDQDSWQIYQSLLKECGWIFPYQQVCIVCDRPRLLRFDAQQRFHADGQPAIQFADGANLYAHHGQQLPECYGTVHPRDWQPQWLFEERDAAVRQTLLHGIGYARLMQDLAIREVDEWEEYRLLHVVPLRSDQLPIRLLAWMDNSEAIQVVEVASQTGTAHAAVQVLGILK
ncbi:MAG: DUF6745 domain-containing protein [Elainellaceae cyanobacterium]